MNFIKKNFIAHILIFSVVFYLTMIPVASGYSWTGGGYTIGTTPAPTISAYIPIGNVMVPRYTVPTAGVTYTPAGTLQGAKPIPIVPTGGIPSTTVIITPAATYILTVTKAGAGSGTVNSNPAGINCGATCSASFSYNTSVTLTVTPAAGSTFIGWSGACSGTGSCTVTMNANKTVNAAFSFLTPTASISADSTSITYNTATTIRWSSTNATSCTVSYPGITSWATGISGTKSTGNLTSSRTYTVNCSGPGGSVSNNVTVNVGGAPTLTFSADSTSVAYNTATTLRWSSANTTYCTASGAWSGGKPLSGAEGTGNLTSNKTYTLTCGGPGASVLKNVTITIQPPGNFNLSLGGSVACNSVPLSWTASSGAEGYKILKDAARADITPYQPYTARNFTDTTVSQNTSYLYQIEAYNAGGTNRSNSIPVSTPYCPPTLNFSAAPTSIYQGQSTTLSWATSYTTSCTASGGWSGSKALSDSEVVIPLPPPSVTYNLTCSGLGGSIMQPVTINISPLLLPDWREIIPR